LSVSRIHTGSAACEGAKTTSTLIDIATETNHEHIEHP